MRPVADGGDDGRGRDQPAVGKLDRRARRRLGADARHDLDPALFELPRGVGGEIGGEGRQDPVRILDQVEADLLGTDVRVVFQRTAHELPELGHGLDAGEARAHDHEGEELALGVRVFGHVGRLQATDDVGPEAMGVGQVLHRERVLGKAGEALEIDAGAETDHKLVVSEIDRRPPRALHHGHGLAGEVDAHDLGKSDLDPPQELAKGNDRVGRMNGRGGNLGKQGLEHEVVVAVDKFDVEPAPAELLQGLGGEHAAKTAADDDNLLLFCRFRHGIFRFEAFNHN